MSDSKDPRNPFENFRIEIDPRHVEEAVTQVREKIEELRERVQEGWDQGRYTKVRLSYKGKRVGPEIPLSVFLAGEGVAFLALTPLSAVLVNLGARAMLEVELVHEADELVSEGLDHYLNGELEQAEDCYRRALQRRDDDTAALYNLGVLLRVSGRQEEALTMLRRAAMGPEGHPDVVKAAETLERLKGTRRL